MIRYKSKRPKSYARRDEELPSACILPKKQSPWYVKLLPEQKVAAEFILSRPATALFSTPGTGKTYVSMAVLERTVWRFALIVAPLTSLGITWRPRLLTLPDVTLLDKPEQLQGALKSTQGRLILLINPEGLRKVLKYLHKWPVDIVIWDESQNIKTRSSINSRLARKLRWVPRRLALSGTPIDSGQIDIWAQMRFVDHEVFGENWRDFGNDYCYKTGWMGKEWRFDDRKQGKFLKALKDHIFRLSDKFLGLEPMTIIPVSVPILGKQHKIYRTMERDSIVQIDGVDIDAQNAGARDIKLAQITGGSVLDRDNIAHTTGSAKERKLRYLLGKIEPPVVIFCQFLHEIDIIASAIPAGYRIRLIHGGVDVKSRTRIVNDFQKGKHHCLICQVRAGGESINLTRACTMVLYSMTFSYINFEQVLRRLHRGGQKNPVRIYVLFCENTIDEQKLNVVKEKCEKSENILVNFEEN